MGSIKYDRIAGPGTRSFPLGKLQQLPGRSSIPCPPCKSTPGSLLPQALRSRGSVQSPGSAKLLSIPLLLGLHDLLGLADLDVHDGLILGDVLVGGIVGLDDDLGAVGDLALEDHLAHRVLDHSLQHAP